MKGSLKSAEVGSPLWRQLSKFGRASLEIIVLLLLLAGVSLLSKLAVEAIMELNPVSAGEVIKLKDGDFLVLSQETTLLGASSRAAFKLHGRTQVIDSHFVDDHHQVDEIHLDNRDYEVDSEAPVFLTLSSEARVKNTLEENLAMVLISIVWALVSLFILLRVLRSLGTKLF